MATFVEMFPRMLVVLTAAAMTVASPDPTPDIEVAASGGGKTFHRSTMNGKILSTQL